MITKNDNISKGNIKNIKKIDVNTKRIIEKLILAHLL
jgi:hypothetical protein